MTSLAIAAVLSRSPRSLPRRLRVENHKAGAWDIDALLDALSILTGEGVFAGYDGEEAAWTGEGFITVWQAGEAVPEFAAA